MTMMAMLPLLQKIVAPPKQTLRTVQPTPSTVCYTVSTRSDPQTVPAQLVHYVSIVLRIVLGVCALLVLLAKWELSFGKRRFVTQGLNADNAPLAMRLVEEGQWRYIVCGALVTLWLVLRRGYTGTFLTAARDGSIAHTMNVEESFLILQGLGVQTSTSSATYLQSATTRFIPTTSVQDIFIHEAFKGFEVRFYLAVVVKGEEDIVVVFPTLLPRRQILEEVWRGARACVFGREQRIKLKDDETKGETIS